MYRFQENADKLRERQLLLRRMFDGRTLLAIGRDLGDDYSVRFNESGYDDKYNYFSEDEVVKRLANILTDEKLLNISQRYRDKLSTHWSFLGRYYTYDPEKKELLRESSWDRIKDEILEVYKSVAEPTYGILKAFLELKKDWTYWSSCEYNPLLFRAEELIGTSRGLKKALSGLQAKGIVSLHKGDVEILPELTPLIKEILDEIERLQKLEAMSPALKQETIEVPRDIFDTVIGYDDVKKLFLMSLKAEKPTHILLVGPPASAKTVMLLEISRLKDAFYLLGGSTTKVGLIDQLFDLRPKYVLLDEADKMNKEDYTALLSLMETGIVKEIKHDKAREITLPARVYAACNIEKYLPPEILSRFHFKLHLKSYTKEEFIEVSKRVLTMREGVDEELATYISNGVAELSKNVRDSVGIARVAKTKDEVDFSINIKRKYAPLQ